MRMIRCLFVIGLFHVLFVASVAEAEEAHDTAVLTLSDGQSDYSLNATMDILEDAARQWSYEDIQSQEVQGRFKSAGGKSSFGYTRSAYWIRAVILNESSEAKWEMILNNSLMDKMEVYAPGGAVFLNRYYPTFAINLPQDQPATVYIRIETLGSMVAPIQLIEQSAVYNHANVELILFGFFYGANFVIVAYQLALYWYTRNRAYLYYTLSVVAFAGGLFIWNGLVRPFIGAGYLSGSTSEISVWNSPSALYDFFYVLGRWMGSLFLLHLLLPRTYAPMADRICRLVNIACPIVCLGIVFAYPLGIGSFLFWFKYVTLLLILWVIIICAWRGSRVARQLAMVKVPTVLVAVVPKALLLLGLLPSNPYTHFSSQFSSIGELIFMAIILYGLMDQMRKKEENAQRKLMNTLEDWNTDLERTVAEQTASLQRANEELEQIQASRTQLLQNISHDIRGPLTYVQGGIQVLVNKLTVAPDQQHYLLGKVYDKVLVVNRYIDDLFEISRAQGMQTPVALEKVVFNDWIEGIFEELAMDIEHTGRRCARRRSTSEADTEVWIDAHLIKRVLSNLVHNACKFTPPDGTITLQTFHRTDAVIIMVGDTGEGIEQEHLIRIFERHYKAGEAQGSGLGLAITKEIVERHGGAIWVESKPGEGSQFYFTLPKVDN
ncbi:sensor histidine kinase [Cohnella fermenti]|uniref:histidine kinase n=1 Tax=Cohnella fermenti TaxID=2565925 RepID=A0A4S4BG82_9BACL|nr:sensor histidine kinase [Cohnella fermenti]THF73215.1 hypothetical protein E6C55_30160 [Cohnella fermenti]